ncbi:MAG: hypothetical protein UMU76_04015, partial [Prosthecochloris sp.]|nr:hypothetical protein [Prosthecochloris sp.]
DRRIKADSHIESENMHISTAHLVGRLKTTAIQHKSLNLGYSLSCYGEYSGYRAYGQKIS